jgi:CRISPR system Cascade subunit CasC
MLIEVHMLQNHAPSNLNRDDTGSPKDCIFGGVRRSRISSQCLKRSVRRSSLFTDAFGEGELAMRTRKLPDQVKKILISRGIAEGYAKIAAIKATGFGTKEGKERPKELNTAQTMFLTEKDVVAVADAMAEAIKECKIPADFEKIASKDLQAQASLRGWRPITPDIALFGRMTTSNAFRDVEASMQVAHAISTNKMDHEFDYFTAVDDLQKKDDEDESAGADMIGDVEFNSACYYKYFSLDFKALVDNLAGPAPEQDGEEQKKYNDTKAAAHEVARNAMTAMLRALVYTTPSGKQNSFAAHQLPDAILVEVRPKPIPVSYANAFLKPANPRGEKDLMDDSLDKLKDHVSRITRKFSLEPIARYWFSTSDYQMPDTTACDTIDELAEALKQLVDKGD